MTVKAFKCVKSLPETSGFRSVPIGTWGTDNYPSSPSGFRSVPISVWNTDKYLSPCDNKHKIALLNKESSIRYFCSSVIDIQFTGLDIIK